MDGVKAAFPAGDGEDFQFRAEEPLSGEINAQGRNAHAEDGDGGDEQVAKLAAAIGDVEGDDQLESEQNQKRGDLDGQRDWGFVDQELPDRFFIAHRLVEAEEEEVEELRVEEGGEASIAFCFFQIEELGFVQAHFVFDGSKGLGAGLFAGVSSGGIFRDQGKEDEGE